MGDQIRKWDELPSAADETRAAANLRSLRFTVNRLRKMPTMDEIEGDPAPGKDNSYTGQIATLKTENAELRRKLESSEQIRNAEKEILLTEIAQRETLQRNLEYARHRWDFYQERNDALSAVVSQLKAHIENAPSNLADTNARLTVQLVEARERINALAVALRKYARHCPGCGMARAISPGQCDCGFIAALAGIPTPPKERPRHTEIGDHTSSCRRVGCPEDEEVENG